MSRYVLNNHIAKQSRCIINTGKCLLNGWCDVYTQNDKGFKYWRRLLSNQCLKSIIAIYLSAECRTWMRCGLQSTMQLWFSFKKKTFYVTMHLYFISIFSWSTLVLSGPKLELYILIISVCLIWRESYSSRSEFSLFLIDLNMSTSLKVVKSVCLSVCGFL